MLWSNRCTANIELKNWGHGMRDARKVRGRVRVRVRVWVLVRVRLRVGPWRILT